MVAQHLRFCGPLTLLAAMAGTTASCVPIKLYLQTRVAFRAGKSIVTGNRWRVPGPGGYRE